MARHRSLKICHYNILATPKHERGTPLGLKNGWAGF